MKSIKLTLTALLATTFLLAFTKPTHADTIATIYDTPPNVSQCEPGVLKESEKQAVLAYVNQIRRLHNLAPVVYDHAYDEETAQASLLVIANNYATHYPAKSAKCYSQAGYNGSSASNLNWIAPSESEGEMLLSDSNFSVRSWLIDDEVFNLGHRRWLLDPFLQKISYGRVVGAPWGYDPTQIGEGSALKVYFEDETEPPTEIPEYVAYPYGDYPLDLFKLDWYWSFSLITDRSNRWNNSNVDYSAAVIQVTGKAGEHTVSNVSYNTDGAGIPNFLQWQVDKVKLDQLYQVEISNILVEGEPKTVAYTTTITTPYYAQLDVPVYEYPEIDGEIPVRSGDTFAIFAKPPLALIPSYRSTGRNLRLQSALHSPYVMIFRIDSPVGGEVSLRFSDDKTVTVRVTESTEEAVDRVAELREELFLPLYVLDGSPLVINTLISVNQAVYIPPQSDETQLPSVTWDAPAGMRLKVSYHDVDTLLITVTNGAAGDQANFRLSDGRTFTVNLMESPAARATPTRPSTPATRPVGIPAQCTTAPALPKREQGQLLLTTMKPQTQFSLLDIADGKLSLISELATSHAYPTWSPDGARIAFLADNHLHVMNADGSNLVQVSDLAATESAPTWSPDGAWLAFSATPPKTDKSWQVGASAAEIYLVQPDGAHLRRLTNDERHDRNPVWSPRGDLIAYVSDPTAPISARRGSDATPTDIFTIHVLDGTKTQIGHPTLHSQSPVWSPDGKQLAFVRKPMGTPFPGNVKAADREHIFLVNADGSKLTQLTPDDVRAVGPSWSPDGRWIAFATQPDYYAELGVSAAYSIKADGSCWTQIAPTVAERTYSVVWSPYDAQIAVISQRAPGFYGSEPINDTITLFDTASSVAGELLELDQHTLPTEPMGGQSAILPTWRPFCALQGNVCELQSFPVLEALLVQE